MAISSLLSSMPAPSCISTQFATIHARTHPRRRAGLELHPPSSMSITAGAAGIPSRRDTRSLRSPYPVVFLSRDDRKISRCRTTIVGDIDFHPSNEAVGTILNSGGSGSCEDEAVAASGGGGDGVFPPPCGGGGRGEEESGSNPGRAEWILQLLVQILKHPKLKNNNHLGLTLAFKMPVDFMVWALRLLIVSNPEGAALAAGKTQCPIPSDDASTNGNPQCPSPNNSSTNMTMVNTQYPSPCDSSTSMSTEDLECPSSLFDAVSSRIGTMSPMRVEGRHSSENHEVESRSVWNRIVQLGCWGPRTARSIVSSVRNANVNRNKEGLLGAFYTIAGNLYIFCIALVVGSLQYPAGANARHKFDDGRMQAIIIGSIILLLTNLFLAPLASYVKDSESVDCVKFKIFKVLLLIVLLGVWAELCAILGFCAATPASIVWTLAIIGAAAILLLWAWVFYVEVPQGNSRSVTEEPRMLLASASEPAA